MLNANVAFMSIPSIVNNNNNGPSNTPSPEIVQTTPAQLASCLSVMASIGSIILGLLLIRENRSKGREGREEAAEAVRPVCVSRSARALTTVVTVFAGKLPLEQDAPEIRPTAPRDRIQSTLCAAHVVVCHVFYLRVKG